MDMVDVKDMQEAREMAKMHDAQQERRSCACGARATVQVGGSPKCPACVEAKSQPEMVVAYTIDPKGVVSAA